MSEDVVFVVFGRGRMNRNFARKKKNMVDRVFAPPASTRDDELTRVFAESARHLARRPANVAYAVINFRAGVHRIMGANFLSPDDHAALDALKRRGDPIETFAALGGRYWMPAATRSAAADPARFLNLLS